MKTKLFTLGVILWLSTCLAAQTSGTCGTNVTWSLQNGVLTISGTGPMDDWSVFPFVPWNDVRYSITQVVIKNGVTNIGNYAFWSDSNLQSITIPGSVTRIGEFSLMDCEKLTSVSIPNNVIRIERAAFAQCGGLTTVTIPNSVTYIGVNAFTDCSGLTSVTIGSGVDSIDGYAFLRCAGLTSITCYAAQPPVLAYNSPFERVNKSIPLYVVTNSLPLYQAADGWKEFTNIIGSLSAIEAVEAETVKIQKQVVNGQLYILLPDGTRYTATGQLVK